jgi:hypothetical protein
MFCVLLVPITIIAAPQLSLGNCTQRFDIWFIIADRFFRDLLVASVLDSGTGTLLDNFWAPQYGESGDYSRGVDYGSRYTYLW